LRIAAAGLLGLLVAAPALARDPSLGWRTLCTPSFRIHFHAGARELALRVANEGERALERLHAFLGYRPDGPIEIALGDESDSANGLASVLPYNRLELLAALPEDTSQLADSDDPIRLLVVHELAHVLHMDQVRGPLAWLNAVLGRTAFPNGAQPTWFTEGLAVVAESRFSGGGRLRSSQFQMMLRTAALHGRVPDLDRLTNTSRAWPQGTAPYLYGAFFLDWLGRRFGDQALADLAEEMSAQLLPWTLNVLARRVLGFDYPRLYGWWRDELAAEAADFRARREAEGLSPLEPLTRRGQVQTGPRLSPGGGLLVYLSASADEPPALRVMAPDGSGDRSLLQLQGGGGLTFAPDGRTLYFSQPEFHGPHAIHQDLYALDLESGEVRRLTRGLRVRAPDVSPDGRELVCVRVGLGRAWLTVLELDTGRVRELTRPGPGVDHPRWSPDGRQVVFSRRLPDGGRALALVAREGGLARDLTEGGFMDIEPVFAPDGARILFSSDRTGVFELWSVAPEARGPGRAPVRLTQTLSGLFSPEPLPDGRSAVASVYGPEGYDLARVELASQAWSTEATRPARPLPEPPAPEVTELEERAYAPWPSLLPRAWLPFVGQDSWGTSLGLTFGGQDALGVMSYLASLSFGLESRKLQADVHLTASLAYPTLSVSFGRHAHRSFALAEVDGRPFPVERDELRLALDLSLPFPGLWRFDSLFVSYDLTVVQRETALPRDPHDLTPVVPRDGPRAYLSLGWYGSDARGSVRGVSPEQGLAASLSVRVAHPLLGTGGEAYVLQGALRAYLAISRPRHHVLALGLQAGLALGRSRQSAFWVGGLPIIDPLEDSLLGYRYGGLFLRGYEPWAFSGSAFLLSSVEYRVPLAAPEVGLHTLPFFLDRVHLAFFADLGGASPEPALATLAEDLLKLGVGAELRLEILLGYYLPASVRLGYARGLMAGGIHNIYLAVGSGF
jgi:hypothetical protein